MFTINLPTDNFIVDSIMYCIPLIIFMVNIALDNIGRGTVIVTNGAVVGMMLTTNYSVVRYRDCTAETLQGLGNNNQVVRHGWMFIICWLNLTAIAWISIIVFGTVLYGGLALLYGLLCFIGFADIWLSMWSSTPQSPNSDSNINTSLLG